MEYDNVLGEKKIQIQIILIFLITFPLIDNFPARNLRADDQCNHIYLPMHNQLEVALPITVKFSSRLQLLIIITEIRGLFGHPRRDTRTRDTLFISSSEFIIASFDGTAQVAVCWLKCAQMH
jgi:hypothetical protein